MILGISFRHLFNSKYGYRTLGGSIMNIGNQLCGISVLIFFSTDLFDKISGNGAFITIYMGIFNFLGSVFGVYAVNRFGRRFNFLCGTFLQFIGFSALIYGIMINYSTICITGVILYMLGFAQGIGGTIMPYMADILPPIGVGFVSAMQWFFTSLIGKTTPYFVDR